MVVNHTSRDWLDVKRGWTLDLVYDSVPLPGRDLSVWLALKPRVRALTGRALF